MIADRWDVYIDQRGEPVVAALGLMEYVVASAPDVTPEVRGRFVRTLEEFKNVVVKVMTAFAERSGSRIWQDPSPSEFSTDS